MNRVAIASALERSPRLRAALWHADELRGEREFDALLEHPRFEARRLCAELLFSEEMSGDLDVKRLRQTYNGVSSHVSRSNLARAAICYREGGIYLDMDVLVLRDLEPLLAYACMLGLEHIVWPHDTVDGVNLYRLIGGPLLGRLRQFLAWAPRGERAFRSVKWLYHLAANGAVLGGAPRHSFFELLLRRTGEVPETEWSRPHRLGTHVLQRTLEEHGPSGLTLLEPAAFFPLGPELSRQYFRQRSDARDASAGIAGGATYLVHWYASVTSLSSIRAEDIESNEGRTIFATLCAPVVRALDETRSSG